MAGRNMFACLEKAEYPFRWDLDFSIEVHKIVQLKQEKKREAAFDAFSRYVYSLVLFYEHARAHNLEDSEQHLKKCSDLIHSEDRVMQAYEPAFLNILAACKLHLKLLKEENIGEDLITITRLEELPIKQQAAIWGTRGHWLMEYGIFGSNSGKGWLSKAVDADPEEATWHMGLGRILFRMRSMELVQKTPPTQKEIHHFREAVRLEKHPAQMVFLATTLIDHVKSTKGVYHEEKTYQDEAHSYLLKAAELSEEVNDPALLTRLARALDRLPKSYQCGQFAMQLFERALEHDSQNIMLNHHVGLAYLKRDQIEKAEKHLYAASKHGNTSAIGQCIIARRKMNPEYDPEALCEELLLEFGDPHQRLRVLYIAADFYWTSHNTEKAMSYLERVKLIDPDNPMTKELQKKILIGSNWRRRI